MTPFLSQVILCGGNYAPEGWLLCDGRLLSIDQNQALYQLLGTSYGGDGQNTFALPDLRNQGPLPPQTGNWCIATSGVWPSPAGG